MSWRCFLAALGVSLCCAASPCLAAYTERVSVSSLGVEGNRYSDAPSISAGGRFVAFHSGASDLVPGDTNASQDVFVHDRVTGATKRVSVSSAGHQGDGSSYYPRISADGRFVAFWSGAHNLVPGDTNGVDDVFVHDRVTRATERVSVSSAGDQGNERSDGGFISAGGRFVTFNSRASNLVPGDTNGSWDGFVRDRATGVTERVSLSGAGDEGNGESLAGAITADGRFVAFSSEASNLVPGDTNGTWDGFVRDRATGVTERVSVSSSGDQGNERSGGGLISADGRFVAFSSEASNLVPGDTNGATDVFVHDRVTGVTERVSLSSAGDEGNERSTGLSVSADFRYIAFQSKASNLVPGDPSGAYDVFVRDRVAGVTERVSLPSFESGSRAHYSCYPSISADGRFVAFCSNLPTHVPDDTNGWPDIFVRDRLTFTDVPVGHWAFHGVSACERDRIVSGCRDGLYHPEWAVSRDQMAVYVSRAMARGDAAVPDGPPEPTFGDVLPEHWAYDYVEYIAANNVAEGYGDGSYHPRWTLTRAEMAVYIARAIVTPTGEAGLADYEPPTTPTFLDVATDFWAYKHVEYLAEEGVVGGYPGGLYHPEYVCTRDQMAVYIARAFGLL